MKETKLNDIAGYETEKNEALKIIQYFKHYDDYLSEGISLPKGLLLTGEPGVGKTLLARAIAFESKSKFIEFKNNDDKIVDNIRKSFEIAKKNKPSILFIDEIDEIVTEQYGEVTDLQKLTLQTLLSEIDGIDNSSGVLVIATANRKFDIPKALIRSGRLEKQITLRIPSFDSRKAIFDLYLSKHYLFKNIDRTILAKKSEGLTGADIKNLTNEVLLESKIKDKEPTIDDFERYIPTIIYSDIKQENDRNLIDFVAAHEIGHFICSSKLFNDEVSISIDRYGDYSGFIRRENKTNEIIKYSTFMNEITVLLGGMAGEKVLLNDVATLSIADIREAYKLIWQTLNSGILGFEYYYVQKEDSYSPNKRISNEKLKLIEDKVTNIFNECFQKAQDLIRDNIFIYFKLVNELKIEGRISSERVSVLLGQ